MSEPTGNEIVTLRLTRNEIGHILSGLSLSAYDYKRDNAFALSKENLELRIKIREMMKS